jgi:hypothetical protein
MKWTRWRCPDKLLRLLAGSVPGSGAGSSWAALNSPRTDCHECGSRPASVACCPRPSGSGVLNSPSSSSASRLCWAMTARSQFTPAFQQTAGQSPPMRNVNILDARSAAYRRTGPRSAHPIRNTNTDSAHLTLEKGANSLCGASAVWHKPCSIPFGGPDGSADNHRRRRVAIKS